MARVLRICRKCGAEIFLDEPEGLCVICVLETSLGMLKVGSDQANGAEMPAELGDYELVEEIGHGGQGSVYRARQKGLNRIVALKVIGVGRWATKAHIKRFRLEAEAAASLDHPCIVPIYEIGESDGSCYFSMKLIEGGQLDQVIKRERIPIRRAAELIAKLARTVHYAHEHGIVHRDIKPGNILVDAKGEPHLTDFGLARLAETESDVTRTIDVLGTPSYMAPEQARGNKGEITTASDVYGLGAVLYYLLTGHPPFAGGTTYETVRLVLETEPRQPRLWNPKIDRDLSTICLKCLEKDPRHRFSSALTLAEDLERWLKHEPIQARHTGILTRWKKWMWREPLVASLIATSVALAAATSVIIWKSELVHRPPTSGIAVLPFENLSNGREDAFFADGVQDDLLTKLAKIAHLRVTSRTSVMQYRDKRNIRGIGKALRVSYVLEGSVRKAGTRLHINAQLIDTRTDTHIWAEQYERDVGELFALQADIAQKVAEKLHAKVSAAERLAIERPPTGDLTVFDLYTRAKDLLLTTSARVNTGANLLRAADLLQQAVGRDPSFVEAYWQLAHTHDSLYHLGFDHTPARLALAEAAVNAAFRLRPDAGETHLARAESLYRGHLDYDGALAELEIAGQTLANNPRVFELKGYIRRRQGKQEEALESLKYAATLDPRNLLILQQIALSYDHLRQYLAEKSAYEYALGIAPDDIDTKVSLAGVEFSWKADVQPLCRVIDSIRATDPAALPTVADTLFVCALVSRNTGAVKDALIALGEMPFSDDVVQFNRAFLEGVVSRMTNDDEHARAAFTVARAEQERIIEAQPDYGPAVCVLGLIDAALGRKQEALREGRRAVEVAAVQKDAVVGAAMIKYLAMIAAWVGDKDLACEQLAIDVTLPGGVSYGELKLLPWWDPLRGDRRFDKIVASLAPK